jgi:hypothetical protein
LSETGSPRWLLGVATVTLAFASGAACKAPAAPPSKVAIRVLDEAKAPIDGAEIASDSAVVARTNPEGLAEVTLDGREGETFNLEVRCPKAYRSPQQPLVIRRIQTADTAEYVTHCSRLRHTLVVGVRAIGGGGNMPIRHLGKEIARTDEAGGANVLIEGEVQERVELQLDTSEPKFAKLHPQNPTGSFEVTNKDEVKVFEVKFTKDRPPPVKVFKRQGPKAF